MQTSSSSSPSKLLFSFLIFTLYLNGILCVNGYIKYNTKAGTVQGKINVHLVPHTHDDVGWLKTVDQYYVGSNSTVQEACVENVLDSVIDALRRDANRKFIYVEMAFFTRWWETQSPEIQEVVKGFVASGQLEFVNGGWCMHDEATTHYIDMIDQTTLGHQFIKKTFNKTPKAGWQIDPFGHSAVQAYLLGFELGFDSVHFSRIDYQDKQKRFDDKSLEVVWRGSKTFGSSNQIFANIFRAGYGAPDGFEFELGDDFVPVQDNHRLFNYNVEQRVNDFINTATDQANVTRTNHIMWTMGEDFEYQYAETWFKELDKLIHYVNLDGRVNVLYSTPSIYADAKHAANESWPLKTADFFPYADDPNSYWTGYFTSRPALKRYVRALSGYYQAARQLEFQTKKNNNSTLPNTSSLGEALATAQHHDAVSGTAKQHTTNDYAKRLAIGASEAEAVVNSALSSLVISGSSSQSNLSSPTFNQCGLLNISYCPPTEQDIPHGKSLVVVAYNALGWDRTDIVRIPVNDSSLVVKDSEGNVVESQSVPLDDVTENLRNLYVKAYTGIEGNNNNNSTPKYWLFFKVSVPPLGWSTYFISKEYPKVKSKRRRASLVNISNNETIVVGSGNLKLSFSSASGRLTRLSNSATGVDIPIKQEYLWYGSYPGDSTHSQASGAYIFRPDGSPHTVVSNSVPLKIIRGELVDEVHQQFGSWIYQVIRVYKDKEHAEVEFTVGPIPIEDGIGKEVITQITADMVTNNVFYTDSNGRDFLKRITNHRTDWNLQVTQPIAGNYYPLNLGIYAVDNRSEFSVLVDRPTGGSSLQDGQIELMLHRRILNDDARGVGEALNETVCLNNKTCHGLTVRGNYYVSINELGGGSRWRRTTGQEIYSPLLLAFSHENSEEWKSSYLTKGTTMASNYTLPPNVALITLQELSDGDVLLRLAHLYEAGEAIEYSKLAKVELRKLFGDKTIKTIKETSLSANQEKSQINRLQWRVEADTNTNTDTDTNTVTNTAPVKGVPVDSSELTVELGPMEIRTFLLNF